MCATALENMIPDRPFLNDSELLALGIFSTKEQLISAARHRALPVARVGHRAYAIARPALIAWLREAQIAP
jgi:hypothetical protein